MFTDYPNGISSFGVPVVGSNPIPFMFDKAQDNLYYFVDVRNGSDSYNGTSPDEPLATIEAAITLANAKVNWSGSPWGVRCVIIIAPGTYAENLTALPWGATLIGCGHDIRDAQTGVKVKPASGVPVSVTSCINNAFYNLCFESTSTSKAFNTTNCNNNVFVNCRFSGAAESVTATHAFYGTDMTATKWINCEFSCAAVGLSCTYVDGGDKFAHCLIQDCRFNQCTTGIEMTSGLVGPSSLVSRCALHGAGQTMTTGISDAPHLLDVEWCCIEATAAVHATHTPRSVNGSYGNGTLLT